MSLASAAFEGDGQNGERAAPTRAIMSRLAVAGDLLNALCNCPGALPKRPGPKWYRSSLACWINDLEGQISRETRGIAS